MVGQTTDQTETRSQSPLPVGPIPDPQLHTSAELIYCSLEEGLIRSVIGELDQAAVMPISRAGIRDHSIQCIRSPLLEELEAEWLVLKTPAQVSRYRCSGHCRPNFASVAACIPSAASGCIEGRGEL